MLHSLCELGYDGQALTRLLQLGGVFAENRLDELSQIGKWMQSGQVKAIIDSKFKFEDAPKAFERSKTGRTIFRTLSLPTARCRQPGWIFTVVRGFKGMRSPSSSR